MHELFLRFTAREQRIIERHRTPRQVQEFLNRLPYNAETPSHTPTLRSFRGVMIHGTTNCIEAALAAAVILEQHRFPPLLMTLESEDLLDHVLFVYRRGRRWGSVARSRDPGLHGRRAVFLSARDLALSYVDPYVDFTGRIVGYAVVDLRSLGGYNWRLSPRHVWKTERLLQNHPHLRIRSSDRRIVQLRRRFRDFKSKHPGRKPLYFSGQERWTEIPKAFRGQVIHDDRAAGLR